MFTIIFRCWGLTSRFEVYTFRKITTFQNKSEHSKNSKHPERNVNRTPFYESPSPHPPLPKNPTNFPDLFNPITSTRRFDLSLNIRAIVAQQLVPTPDGKGRVAAIEILLNSPLVRDLIQRNEIGALKEAMKKGKEQGMQSFDMALYDLYKAGKIDMDQALHHADSPNDLRLMIKLDTSDGSSLGTLSNVSIDMDD